MKIIYLAHPYSDIPDKNCEENFQDNQKLAEQFPNILFIDPLQLMKAAGRNLPYRKILKQTIEIMKRCDGVIMNGNWKKSKGCLKEYDEAKRKKMKIWNSLEEFCQAHNKNNK